MAQLSPMQRQSRQSPKTPNAQPSPMQIYSPKTQTSPIQRYSLHQQSPKTTPMAQSSPTFEQLLHGGIPQARHSESAGIVDMEEDFTPHSSTKKSVLSKWRDRVKKLRHNIRSKKMYEYPYYYGNTTPSWGVTLDDEDQEDDEDPEYLGAPMYESELAPEAYKETARQHPRAHPVVSEKRAVPNMVARNQPQPEEDDDKITRQSKTITETVSEKLAPAYAAVSDVTHTIASSIVNLKITSSSSSSSIIPKDQEIRKDIRVSASQSVGALPLHTKQQPLNQQQQQSAVRDQNMKSPEESDKGISVKEYVMHKLEPGDDEKALSKAVCEALSPKKALGETSSFTGSVVGKVREVVTSLLRDPEERSNSNNKLAVDLQKVSANPNVSLKHAISAPSTNLSPHLANASSSPIPVSTHPHQVNIVADQEENLGRILQAN